MRRELLADLIPGRHHPRRRLKSSHPRNPWPRRIVTSAGAAPLPRSRQGTLPESDTLQPRRHRNSHPKLGTPLPKVTAGTLAKPETTSLAEPQTGPRFSPPCTGCMTSGSPSVAKE
jgi:hypothetical protein